MWRWPCKNIHSWIPKNHSNNLNERTQKKMMKRKKLTWKQLKSIHAHTKKNNNKIETTEWTKIWAKSHVYVSLNVVIRRTIWKETPRRTYVKLLNTYRSKSKKIKDKTKTKTKYNVQNERRSRSKRNGMKKKKLMMTIMSVKSECRTHMNVDVVAYVRACVCVQRCIHKRM